MMAAALLWSTSGLGIKTISLSGLPLACWRSLFGGIAMAALAPALGIRITFRLPKRAWIGVAAYSVTLLLFVLANKRTTAANVIFLQYTAPFYILILEPRLLGTRFHWRDLAFVLVAFGGMGLFFVDRLGAGQWTGNLLALASGATFAALTLALRSTRALSERWSAAVIGNFILAAPLIALPWLRPGMVPETSGAWLGLVFLGVLQIGLAYVFYTYSLGHLSALEAILISALEPVLNPVWVYLGTGERPGPWAMVGGTLILAAIIARVLTTTKSPEPATNRDYSRYS